MIRCLLVLQGFIYGLRFSGLSHDSQHLRVTLNIPNSSMYLEYQVNNSSHSLQLTQILISLACSTYVLSDKNVVYFYKFTLRPSICLWGLENKNGMTILLYLVIGGKWTKGRTLLNICHINPRHAIPIIFQ